MGGLWRLGCDVCAWKRSQDNQKQEKHEGKRRGNDIRASIFSTFSFLDVTPLWGVLHNHVQQHAYYTGHRVAAEAAQRVARQAPSSRPLATEAATEAEAAAEAAAELRPLATDEVSAAIAEAESAVLNDAQLLKGRVPQPRDWLCAWAETTEELSFHKQARIDGKKNTLRYKNTRRIRRKQLKIIAETRREDIRNMLRSATCIALSMDDRKYQKIVRFRCDAPEKPYMRRGILGVLGLQRSAVGDFEEDHALVATRKMDRFLNRFCTPLSKNSRPLATDLELKEHIRKHVRVFAADGASKERRALLMSVQEVFPNVSLLIRDAAHALRIAIKDPLHFDKLFGEVWEVLFDTRHALVPDVMNSEKWQDLLQHIQRVVLRIPAEDRPLAVVLKHLRFAKQRFDSSADPMAKVALMLLPLATLLAYIGSDERHALSMRDRAKKILKKLDSKFCLAIGVSADWGLVCQAFLRLFDKTSHDLAKTYKEIDGFIEVLRALFQEGRVFYSSRETPNAIERVLPAVGGYFGKKGVKPMFITHRIEETLRRRAVFNCGSEQVLLWGQPKPGEVKEIAERLQFVTPHVIRRIQVEFAHLYCFRCFDVPAVREAYGGPVALRQSLNRDVRSIAKDLGVDAVEAATEYQQVAQLIVDLTSPGRPLATATNNEVWAGMLAPNVRLSHLPGRSNMRFLNLLIRFYICIEDGSCAVERDLGVLTNVNHEYKNGDDELADDVLLAKDDTTTPSDIGGTGLAVGSAAGDRAAPAVGSELPTGVLGPKGRRWAKRWREVYGARLGLNRERQAKQIKLGTYTAVKKGVLAAAEYAVAAGGGADLAGGDAVTSLGVEVSFFASAVGDDKKEAYSNKAFEDFDKLTANKQLRTQHFLSRVASKRLELKRAAKPPEPLRIISKVCYLGDVGESLPQQVSEDRAGVHEVIGRWRCWNADLVVVADLSSLHDCPDDHAVNQVLSVVGLGRPVITSASWTLAKGDHHLVPKESVIRHRPLAIEKKVAFHYDGHFEARSGNVLDTLKHLSRIPKSKWTVVRADAAPPPAAVGAEAAVGANVVQLTGIDVVRRFLQNNRRIYNVTGSRAWTLTERMM